MQNNPKNFIDMVPRAKQSPSGAFIHLLVYEWKSEDNISMRFENPTQKRNIYMDLRRVTNNKVHYYF